MCLTEPFWRLTIHLLPDNVMIAETSEPYNNTDKKDPLTLTVPATTIDALQHFETG